MMGERGDAPVIFLLCVQPTLDKGFTGGQSWVLVGHKGPRVAETRHPSISLTHDHLPSLLSPHLDAGWDWSQQMSVWLLAHRH